MPNQVSKAKLGSVASCMTCPLCHELFRDATTIIECLHTFCRKCIFQKLLDEEMECCPVCNSDLGCAPLEKLRPDHNLQDIRAEIFPYKRTQVKAPEVATPVTLPAKRKERSLSSLVVSTPRVSTQNGMTGRRSKSTARKASRGSSFIVEKHFRKEEDSSHHPESSSSREILAKFTQIARQNLTAAESSNHPNSDKGRENGSEVWEGKLDLNGKPLTCLVEAANRSKSSKFTTQESGAKSESHDNERDLAKTKHKENRLKSEVQAQKCTVHVPQESERPEELRRGRQKKGENSGEFRVPPQAVLDAACAKFERKNHPIRFSPVASVEQDGDAPLPQIASSYLKIKLVLDKLGSMDKSITALNRKQFDLREILLSLKSDFSKELSAFESRLSLRQDKHNSAHFNMCSELSDQMTRFQAHFDQRMDAQGAQLHEIIEFLIHGDVKRRECGRQKQLQQTEEALRKRIDDRTKEEEAVIQVQIEEAKNHPIWFSPVASVEQDGDAPLPQIASSYLRIKLALDKLGNMDKSITALNRKQFDLREIVLSLKSDFSKELSAVESRLSLRQDKHNSTHFNMCSELSGQMTRFQAHFDQRMDAQGVQLHEIMEFLIHGDVKKRECGRQKQLQQTEEALRKRIDDQTKEEEACIQVQIEEAKKKQAEKKD